MFGIDIVVIFHIKIRHLMPMPGVLYPVCTICSIYHKNWPVCKKAFWFCNIKRNKSCYCDFFPCLFLVEKNPVKYVTVTEQRMLLSKSSVLAVKGLEVP